jgi:very-short-patch-repair endonuclease
MWVLSRAPERASLLMDAAKLPLSAGLSASMSIDARVAKRATCRHGIVTRSDLLELGLDDGAIGRRVEAGTLRRLHRGVFLYGLARPTRRGRWLAAVLACGPSAVLSHRDAAALHGIRPCNRARVDVTTRDRGRHGADGVELHLAQTLHPDDVTVVEGIRVTTVARTLLDLAPVVAPDHLAKAIHEWDVTDPRPGIDLASVDAVLVRNPRRRGARALREALPRYRPRGRSDFEDALADLVAKAGFEAPERNSHPDVNEDSIELDLYWPRRRLCIEADSWSVHGTVKAFHADRRKDRRLNAAGIRPLRFTWEDVHDNCARTLAELRRIERATRPGRPQS